MEEDGEGTEGYGTPFSPAKLAGPGSNGPEAAAGSVWSWSLGLVTDGFEYTSQST